MSAVASLPTEQGVLSSAFNAVTSVPSFLWNHKFKIAIAGLALYFAMYGLPFGLGEGLGLGGAAAATKSGTVAATHATTALPDVFQAASGGIPVDIGINGSEYFVRTHGAEQWMPASLDGIQNMVSSIPEGASPVNVYRDFGSMPSMEGPIGEMLPGTDAIWQPLEAVP